MDSGDCGVTLDLDNWLSIATRKLCSESQERIRKEIKGHYLDFVDETRAKGYRDVDAQRLAIESLGDPKSAARSFRKHHLTEFQAGLVKDVGRKPPKYRYYLYIPAFTLACVTNVTQVSNVWDLIIYVGMLLVMLSALASHFWWARWLYHHGQARASLMVDMLSTWVFFASMQFGSSLLWHSRLTTDTVVYGAALLLMLMLLAPLLHKMSDRTHKSA